MIDSNVKVGSVVFAGDLVKVLHGTKYYNITYYDLAYKNIVNRLRAHRGFELLSTDYNNFDYWLIDDNKYLNCQYIDTGLTTDVSAYMYVSSYISVNFLSSSTHFREWYLTYDNLTYLSAIDSQAQVQYSYCDIAVSSNTDVDVTYTNHRFLGWKRDNVGDLILPGTIIRTNYDANFIAQWIRQYKLALNLWSSLTSKGKAGKKISPASNSPFDIGTKVVVRALPNENYHLSSWVVYSLVENNTPNYQLTSVIIPCKYDPYNPQHISKYDLNLTMSADLSVNPEYAIDTHILTLSVDKTYLADTKEFADCGDIKFTLDGKTTITVNTSADYKLDHNTFFTIEAVPKSDAYKFISWLGDVQQDMLYYSTIYLNLPANKKIRATFAKKNTWKVTFIVDLSTGGRIENNLHKDIKEIGVYYDGDPVILTAVKYTGFDFKEWEWKDTEGNTDKFSAQTFTLTNSIKTNYIVTAKFDTWLIDNNISPITDHTGIEVIQYSGIQ